MKTAIFTPLDTLFFRDGRPYNQQELNQTDVASRFPPAPPPLVGALRAALARGQGWSQGDWTPDIKAVLGDGEALGALQFFGPYLLRQDNPLFPVPTFLLGIPSKGKEGEWTNITRLRPGPLLYCDLSGGKPVRLPVPEESNGGLKEMAGCWITLEAMEKILDSGLPSPEEIIASKQILREELRVGIERNDKTRTTEEGALYSSRHIRLDNKVALALQIYGLAAQWNPVSPAPVGGENRMAWIDIKEGEVPLPPCPDLSPVDGKVRYTVILLTPATLPGAAWPGPGDSLDQMPGKIVSACIGRPLQIGGWDSIGSRPLPLHPFLPAGSAWFMEADASQSKTISDWHGKKIGERAAWGFGQVLIGTWKEETI